MKATRLFTTIVTALSLCAVCNLVQGCRQVEKEYRLTHRAHDITLMNNVQIAATDSFIVLVSNYFENGFCHTYSIKGDRLEFCSSYGSIGSGESEFRQHAYCARR